VFDGGAATVGVNQNLVVIYVPFSDPDIGDTHTATINWGDGAVSGGLIQGGAVNGAHIYSATGSYGIGVLLSDSGGEVTTYNYTVQVTALSSALPGVALCAEYNGVTDTQVIAGVPDAIRQSVFCRILAQLNDVFRGIDALPGEFGTVGVQSLVSQGVVAAVDVFTPNAVTAFEGVAICLRGSGSMVLLAGVDAPRTPIGLGTFLLATAPGFTCAAVPQVGTVVLVRNGSAAEAALAAAITQGVYSPRRDYAPGLIFAADPRCVPVTRGMVYVRSAPSENSFAYGLLGNRTPVIINDQTGIWYHVTVSSAGIGTRDGYIRADLVGFQCILVPIGSTAPFDETGAVG
jgi:hypothetical protein